ncbi:MAG: PAS domain S-box protein [Oscillochloris sp.]|nr:PAS domain S-box protein [Oscillochloris sp.]
MSRHSTKNQNPTPPEPLRYGWAFIDRELRVLSIDADLSNLFPVVGALGQPIDQVLPAVADAWKPLLLQVIATGQAICLVPLATKVIGNTEAQTAPLANFFPILSRSGLVSGVDVAVKTGHRLAVTFSELSEHRQAELGLSESETRFRHLADHAPMIVWMTDPEGACTYLSTSWHAFTGQAHDQGLGTGWMQVVHPDDRNRTHEVFISANSAQVPFRLDYRLRRHDGVYRWAIDSATPRFDQDGRFLGYIGSVIDITERKEAEQALRAAIEREQQLRAQAEAANRLKDDFLSTVSHELRTPLTALLGYAQLLQIKKRDEAYIARTVERIVQSAKTQAQLVEDLLDVSRIMSGKLRITLEPLDFATVIHAALDTILPTVEVKGIAINLALDRDIGAIIGDKHRLQQVVWNLLVNAVKFTPPGGTITIELAPHNHEAVLRIHDTGQGIQADFLPFVFDRFRQSDSTSQRLHGGLGLGLSIVRHLVDLHGGNVEAASEGIGLGATFTVRLPLTASEATSDPLPEQPGINPRTESRRYPPELADLRILIVDDQPDILNLLHEILASCGSNIRTCRTARAALENLSVWRPDLLIADIAMPGEDGYWLIRRVRELPPEQGGRIPRSHSPRMSGSKIASGHWRQVSRDMCQSRWNPPSYANISPSLCAQARSNNGGPTYAKGAPGYSRRAFYECTANFLFSCRLYLRPLSYNHKHIRLYPVSGILPPGYWRLQVLMPKTLYNGQKPMAAVRNIIPATVNGINCQKPTGVKSAINKKRTDSTMRISRSSVPSLRVMVLSLSYKPTST